MRPPQPYEPRLYNQSGDNQSGATPNAMRAISPDWQIWLRASLFPFKIYTAAAVLPLIIWHERLPPSQSPGFDDYAWMRAVTDLSIAASDIRLGYFLAALILVIGGLAQWSKWSEKTAFLNLAFGIGALAIGFWLHGYCQYHDMRFHPYEAVM